MLQFMHLEVTWVSEIFITDVTPVRSRGRVSQLVAVQARVPCKSLEANVTFKLLDFGMGVCMAAE